MHSRTQIRDHVVTQLAGIGATVSKSRIHNLQTADLPAVIVYTLSEASVPVTIKRTQERTLQLIIDIHVRSIAGDVDDDVDALCVEVEKAIEADWQFNRLALRPALVQTEIGISGEAEGRHGLAQLTYAVVYRTDPTAPDA